jgi:predicted YcjX-like family ATPase
MSAASPGWLDSVRLAVLSLGEAIAGVANPTIRLGVTGLSRSGKTVFTTALVHHLMMGTVLPLLSPIRPCRALPMRPIWRR